MMTKSSTHSRCTHFSGIMCTTWPIYDNSLLCMNLCWWLEVTLMLPLPAPTRWPHLFDLLSTMVYCDRTLRYRVSSLGVLVEWEMHFRLVSSKVLYLPPPIHFSCASLQDDTTYSSWQIIQHTIANLVICHLFNNWAIKIVMLILLSLTIKLVHNNWTK